MSLDKHRELGDKLVEIAHATRTRRGTPSNPLTIVAVPFGESEERCFNGVRVVRGIVAGYSGGLLTGVFLHAIQPDGTPIKFVWLPEGAEYEGPFQPALVKSVIL